MAENAVLTNAININGDEVATQYKNEHTEMLVSKKRTEFSPKNYLQARLGQGETSKTLAIRLLPFSTEGGTPFKKIFIHTVKVNKEVSSGGWKTFICPTHNKFDDKCPFCQLSTEARVMRMAAKTEPEKKKYGDIEFMNRVKAAWIVRCIERGHEEDGVKFWLFNDSKKNNGVFDQIMNIYEKRKISAERKGKTSNIFDLIEGKDLIISLTKDSNGKTVTNIVDDEDKSPLSDDYEQIMKWVKDEKTWNQVYTVKPYAFMEIVINGGVPVYDKNKQMYVDLNDKKKADEEATKVEIKENLTPMSHDFSEFIKEDLKEDDLSNMFIN